MTYAAEGVASFVCFCSRGSLTIVMMSVACLLLHCALTFFYLKDVSTLTHAMSSLCLHNDNVDSSFVYASSFLYRYRWLPLLKSLSHQKNPLRPTNTCGVCVCKRKVSAEDFTSFTLGCTSIIQHTTYSQIHWYAIGQYRLITLANCWINWVTPITHLLVWLKVVHT